MKLLTVLTYLLVPVSLSLAGERTSDDLRASPALRSQITAQDAGPKGHRSPCTTCPDRYGISGEEKPIFRWGFSNAETLMVCGALDSLLGKSSVRASEFEVINCRTGAVLYVADALEPRILRGRSDLLEVAQFVSIPTGSNWTYRNYPMQQWYVRPSADSIALFGPKYVLNRPNLGRQWLTRALAKCDSLLKAIHTEDDPVAYCELYQDLLFACMIEGSQDALTRFNAFTQEPVFDGATSEIHHMIEEDWDLIKDHVTLK